MKNLRNILMIFSLLASVLLVGCQKFEELERKGPQNVLRGSESDDVTDIDEDEDDAGITDVDEDEDEEAGSGKGSVGSGTINDDDEDEDEATARISH